MRCVLSTRAAKKLSNIGVSNIEMRVGDGAMGWSERGPFDRILLTAAATEVPESLLFQLRDGGALLGPVKTQEGQEIVRLTRHGDHFELKRLKDCSFVPLIRGIGNSIGEAPAAP